MKLPKLNAQSAKVIVGRLRVYQVCSIALCHEFDLAAPVTPEGQNF
ncbi:hypothetical protein ABH945_005131 [Paraburkholderia sp. GAS333]